MNNSDIWLIVGFMGQFLFSMRFIVQWIVSEKNRKSIIPTSFWFFSISGGVVLLTYALYKRDPVFIVGQGLGVFIYIRNIYLIYKEKSHSNPL